MSVGSVNWPISLFIFFTQNERLFIRACMSTLGEHKAHSVSHNTTEEDNSQLLKCLVNQKHLCFVHSVKSTLAKPKFKLYMVNKF